MSHSRNVTKQLKLLAGFYAAKLVMSLLPDSSEFYVLFNNTPVSGDNPIKWIGRFLTMGILYCLFRLTSESKHYRRAFLFHTICFLEALPFTLYIPDPYRSFISDVTIVISLAALHQEYTAHGSLLQEIAPGFSRKWRRLFFFNIGGGILLILICVIAVILLNYSGADGFAGENLIWWLTDHWDSIFEIVYILYLCKTIDLMEKARSEP